MIWSLGRGVDTLGRPCLRSEVAPETRLRKYDPTWLDGRTHTVWQGVDFDRSAYDLRLYLHEIARSRGMYCRASVNGDSVTFQFTPKESP